MIKQFGFGKSSFGFKTFGFGVSAYDAIALFASGQQGALYDPSDLSKLYQDAAGTIPVTANGDPVGLMLDKSGNGNHAKQTLSAARPIYRTDGILHWLEFDGVDDFLYSPVVTWQAHKKLAGSISYLYRGASESIAIPLNMASTGVGSLAVITGDTEKIQYSPGSVAVSATAASGLPVPRTSVLTFAANHNTPAIKSKRNGLPYVINTTGTPSVFNNDRIYLGSQTGGTERLIRGSIYGAVLFEGEFLAGNDISLEQYLARKSGVTL